MDYPRAAENRPYCLALAGGDFAGADVTLAARAALEVRLLLVGRGLRGCVDGYVAVLLPAYLLALGYDIWHVGVLSTATLLGSALATLALVS